MIVTIDKAGRVVIPAPVRERLGLRAGTGLELSLEDAAIRLVPAGPRPELVKRRGRLVARPTVGKKACPTIDVATLVEEERSRWP